MNWLNNTTKQKLLKVRSWNYMWCSKEKHKKWTLVAALVFAGTTAFSISANAQVGNVADITSQPKAETDRLLDELDDESGADEAVAAETKTTSEVAASKRISSGSTIFINFEAQEEDDSVEELSPLVPKNKIFVVNSSGYVTFPVVGKFKLAGLTEDEAELRLSAESVFSELTIEVNVLPVEKEGEEVLTVFGSSLFENTSNDASTGDIPVPPDYVVGPGDELNVQLYGGENTSVTLVVSRDGTIDFPEIGPIPVAGQTFAEMRSNLNKRVEKQLIGVKIYVTLGELRSINVLVVGEVESPGTYVVGALSSVIDVLTASGGISEIGSFRNIALKRSGKVVSSVDLYDLLLKGNISSEVRLQSGDVVFVPPIKSRVAVTGEVKRPAIYEVDGDNSLQAVIKLAGGLSASAFSQSIQIERVAGNNKRVLLGANYASAAGKTQAIKDGDIVTIPAVDAELDDAIQLHGHVLRAGSYSWHEGISISDVIPSVSLLKKKNDLEYVVVKRQKASARGVDVFSLNLAEALKNKKGPQDFVLQPNDEIFVFGFSDLGQRQHFLSPLIEILKQQASLKFPAKVVSVEGGVFESGTYPLVRGMRVSDLVKAAGNLTETANSHVAELTRVTYDRDGDRSYEHVKIRLDDIFSGNRDADFELQSYDTLTIKSDPRWTKRYAVEITGEVKYPGVYQIARGEQISSVIERAGGLTDIAFPEGVVLSRDSIKEAEGKEMLALADKLEVGLKATILERADENLRPNESSQVAADVINLLRNAEPLGRVVMDLPLVLEESSQGKVSDADVMLFDGDEIFIPPFKQAVSVIGEVNHPTTHIYADGKSVKDYLEMSGGITQKSNNDLVFVIRANGSAVSNKSWWSDEDILPGDTIIVSLDVEKIRTLKKWSEIANIFGNLLTPTATAVNAAAAWESAQAAKKQADNSATIIIGQ